MDHPTPSDPGPADEAAARKPETATTSLNPSPANPPPPVTGAIPRKKLPKAMDPVPGQHAGGHPPAATSSFPSHPTPPMPPQAPAASTVAPPPRPFATASTPIPRKPRARPLPISKKTQRALPTRTRREPYISIKSDDPFIVSIKKATKIPINNGGIPLARSSARMPKRKRPSYEEMRDTDSDDFLTESDTDNESLTKKKRLQKSKRRSPVDSLGSSSGMQDVILTDAIIAEDGIDSPPPGTLSTLWYSREVFLNLFVIEKIIGWRVRSIVALEWADVTGLNALDPSEAAGVSTKLLIQEEIWTNQQKRLEVSRINAAQCPLVMAVMAAKEGEVAQARQMEPRYKLAPQSEDQTEEVLLVKWRGRSHVHCSWERRKDLEKFDPTNTARNKIRRYFQGQEMLLGPNWRHIILEERNGEGHDATSQVDEAEHQAIEEEEVFPAQYVEVERILACDENAMNLEVLAKQRALNRRSEQEKERKREEAEAKARESGLGADAAHVHLKPPGLLENLPRVADGEEPWDPEDNVRYVVKWKGLQFAEITWEYWRDIKRDSVDEAEDFWFRQKAPTPVEVNGILSRPHPHVRNFRKLASSPQFAVSRRPRPIADLDDGFVDESRDDEENEKAFKLRSYQLEGVNWLLFNWFNKRSCILADEMGLGKTIQTVCFLHQLHELSSTQVRGPFLVVAPLTLIGQWQSESQTWAPDLNVVFYHGSANARDFLVQQEFYYTDQFVPKPHALKLRKNHITKFHILITTYEVVLKDVDVLSKIRWKALVVDEAHRLKNHKSRLFEELARVPREFCLLLTGTPLQNSTEELWALLNFADPKGFASKDDFVDKFGQLKDAKQVSDLHAMLKPYLLRRVKEDVEKSLPPKEETILEVSLTPVQKTYYKAIYERNTTFLFKGAKPNNAPSLMNVMMELRKCCNHPFLIRSAEERILNDAAANLKDQTDESGHEVPIDYLKLFEDQLVKSSGKMVLLEKLLPKLYAGGHKVLIFSQMVRALDLLEELLKIKKYRYERLDGSTVASARSAAVHRFHRKSCQRFVMLLSTRAGGLGLNLTAADVVIIFDSDFNPQNDLQAMARAHRIGQTRAVSVYRLLTAKTYEAHMLHSASMKLGLDRAVLAHQRQRDGEAADDSKKKSKSEREVQAREIDQLLKKGAYDIFRDDDDEEAKKFMETDIDQLLERSAKKVSYGNVNSSSISSGLGSFSKASFVADTGDGEKDVDLDDPDFWEKAVGLDAPEETPEDVAQMIDDGVKRSRKQVQQFDPYSAFVEAEQKKKDKEAQKAKEEKEEKQRLRMLKKQRRLEEKERKKKEKQEIRGRLFASKRAAAQKTRSVKVVKTAKARDGRLSKKLKKYERQRAVKRAENEDPVLERLKQAWELSQRNRATSAALRFGFGRFCKIRSESGITSLPIQDLEVFVRQYIYQLALQVAVTLLAMLKGRSIAEAYPALRGLRGLLRQWLGPTSAIEMEWICSAISSAMAMQIEVEDRRRLLRMPFILAEPAYVSELRQGAGLRALRRISVLTRLNRLVEDALDSILTGLGHEELGKRGCPFKDLSALDADLRARHVTTEELILGLGLHLQDDDPARRKPAIWWDRSCDLALVLGSFVHGFGSYEAMRRDEALPFSDKLVGLSEVDSNCSNASYSFSVATQTARKACDAALESAKSKMSEEAHMMVAAVVKARKEAEKEGLSASSVVPSDINIDDVMEVDDSHLITLPRLAREMAAAIRGDTNGVEPEKNAEVASQSKSEVEDDEEDADMKDEMVRRRLPMPDARILDLHLVYLLCVMEKNAYNEAPTLSEGLSRINWEASESVLAHEAVRSEALARIAGLSEGAVQAERHEFEGIGFSGIQCGTTHRTLNDTSEFCAGPASRQLSHVAHGPDAPRYLRAMCVPMNLTRFAIVALIHADESTLGKLLSDEQRRRKRAAEIKAASDAAANEEEEKKEGIPDGQTEPDDPKSEDRNESSTVGEMKEDSNEERKGSSTEDTKKESPETEMKPDPSNEAPVPSAIPLVLPEFRDNARLRAGICASALHFGFPSLGSTGPTVHPSFLATLDPHAPHSMPSSMLDKSAFAAEALQFVQGSSLNVKIQDVTNYVESVLLPHCLRLCINGNGPTTSNARASRGRFETALGYSLYPEYTSVKQTPLPDPCATLPEHSVEAVTCATAILRRVRLLRAAQYLVSQDVTSLVTLLKSYPSLDPSLSHGFRRTAPDDLPVWWCPEIHDVALVVSAATRGLCGPWLSRRQGVFAPHAIQQHLYERMQEQQQGAAATTTTASTTTATTSTTPATANSPAISATVHEWVVWQSHREPPSPNALERRLAYICALATTTNTTTITPNRTAMVSPPLDDVTTVRYDHLPMFDHGGWPRN